MLEFFVFPLQFGGEFGTWMEIGSQEPLCKGAKEKKHEMQDWANVLSWMMCGWHNFCAQF